MKIFIQTPEGFTPDWQGLYEFHQLASRDEKRTAARQDWHRTQSFLIWVKHLKPENKSHNGAPRGQGDASEGTNEVWNWEKACAYAVREIRPL
jgi:hypothetical protein